MHGVRQRAREIAEQFNQRFVYDATYAALGCLKKEGKFNKRSLAKFSIKKEEKL